MVLSIYFPKQVAIDNPRLWVVQTCCHCLTAFVVMFSLAYTKLGYVQQVMPDSLLTPWVTTPNIIGTNILMQRNFSNQSSIYWGTDRSAAELQRRANSGIYNYMPKGYSYIFEKPTVAIPCNGHSKGTAFGISCLSQGDTYRISKGENIENRYVEETMFIPTAYNEEFYVPGKNATNCPNKSHIEEDEQECRWRSSWLVPGVEDFGINFMHHYDVTPPKSMYHRMFNIDRSIKGRLQVTVRDKDDEPIFQFVEDEIVNVTIKNLLRLAQIKIDEPMAGPGFPQNEHAHKNGSATARVTGIEITLELDYLNEMLERGPLCNIKVTGKPAWMGMTDNQIIHQDGTMKTRAYSGIRVRFVRKGNFEYFVASELISTVTTLIVWLRIPGFFVFYFAVFCLGTLSKVYTRFLYQDLNLLREFNGVSARLLKRAHGFNDLHDLVDSDGTRAISFAQAKKRMTVILSGRKELDEAEREYFISYFFSKTASKLGEDEGLAIILEDYLKAVSSEENLQYNEIMMFVDTDGHKTTFLERLFIDKSLKQFITAGKVKEVIGDSGAGALEPSASTEGDMVDSFTSVKTAELEKQAGLFENRMAGTRLNLKLDQLEKELDHCREHRDQLASRSNDYCHYLAHLQEKIEEARYAKSRKENAEKGVSV